MNFEYCLCDIALFLIYSDESITQITDCTDGDIGEKQIVGGYQFFQTLFVQQGRELPLFLLLFIFPFEL